MQLSAAAVVNREGAENERRGARGEGRGAGGSSPWPLLAPLIIMGQERRKSSAKGSNAPSIEIRTSAARH